MSHYADTLWYWIHEVNLLLNTSPYQWRWEPNVSGSPPPLRTTAWLDLKYFTLEAGAATHYKFPWILSSPSALHPRLANCSTLKSSTGLQPCSFVYELSMAAMAKLRICNRNHMASKAKSIYCLALYRKCLRSLIYTSGSLVWGHLSSAHMSVYAICYSKHFKGRTEVLLFLLRYYIHKVKAKLYGI